MRGRKNAGYQSVTTTHARPASVEEGAACSRRGLDVRIVERPAARRAPPVVGHAVEDEAMQPIVGVRVVAAQRFEDDERLTQLDREIHRALQPEVPTRVAAPPIIQ